MASTGLSGSAECEHIDDVACQVTQVDVLGNQPGSPLSERIQDIPRSLSTTMEPTSRLHSLGSWLLAYLRSTCVILGYLGTCLPSIRVDRRDEEANLSSNAVDREQSVHIMDSSNVGDSDHRLESKHKIFLSHSGAQKDFVEQLCVDLERCDRYSFFDKRRNSLPIGEDFPKLIFDAIGQCWVGVVVLSEEFFMRSKWPMLELNAMVKEYEKPNSRIKIIPIFYHISSDAIKDPKNMNQWISQWKKWAVNDKCGRINVAEWERAVRVMGFINGLKHTVGCGDVKIREEIVSELCGLVPSETRWDDSHVQGQSRSCKTIRDKIGKVLANSKVCVVGLYGMGGIGKTTISKALCNDLALQFGDNVCHIELGSGSNIALLLKALKKFANIRHDVLDKVDDIEQGFAYLKKKLHTQPVFLALDNVEDDYKSLEIAGTYLRGGYGCGSVVLVTSRSLEVLRKLNLMDSQCLEMPELEHDEAKTLFLNYAGLASTCEVDEVVLEDCIERCHFLKGDGKSRHYHPLALKVLGQQLGSKSVQWVAQLGKIDAFKHRGDKEHPVFSILRSSFDSLDDELQTVFMDLTLLVTSDYDNASSGITRRDWLCMVHGESIEDMKDMLEVLKGKSLIEDVSDNFSEIGIHDLWIEFAVAESKAQNVRGQQWVYHVDGKKGPRRNGRGWESVKRMCFLNDGWRSLKKLNLADFVNVEAFKLEVEILMADCTLDLDLSGLKQLKSLEMDTPGLTVRAGGLSSLTNLVFLYWITPGILTRLDGIGCLTNLQYLELLHFKGIEVLDLTELKLLRKATINGFSDLTAVTGLSSRMANLRFLYISQCKMLQECPGVGELYVLEELVLDGCGKLKELPCLGRLIKLRELHINYCKSLRAVPGLSDLVALEEVYAEGCLNLAALPDLVKLTKLQVLDIETCPMQEVPGLDSLLALTTLYASFYKLSGELIVLSKLSSLKMLKILGWNGPIWTSIGNLLMLEELRLVECKGEDIVPDLQNLERLKIMEFFECDCKDLSGLSNLTALESLYLDDCDKLERLPEFERLLNLVDLRITGCSNLRDWPRDNTLCSLEYLGVDGSSWMRVVREVETLTGLRELELWDCGCEVLSMASSLSQLETLEINGCSTMEALDVSNFLELEKLELDDCSALQRVTCSRPLSALEKLKVVDCESLVEIPDLSTFPELEKVRLERCGGIKRLSCSGPLTALRKIILIGCNSEVEMPEFSWFPMLEEFRVEEDLSSDDDEDDEDDESDDEDDEEDDEDDEGDDDDEQS